MGSDPVKMTVQAVAEVLESVATALVARSRMVAHGGDGLRQR